MFTFESMNDSPHRPIDLGEAAVAIALDEYPSLDAAQLLSRLDRIADATGARAAPPEDRLRALDHHLFETLGLRGNERNYYDPRNSYLNDVLDRGLGIPISLSVVYIEVGRRLGLDVHPISFPAHFLVKCSIEGRPVVIDAFGGGARLDGADLIRRLAPLVGGEENARRYLPRALGEVSNLDVVARMLRNLKAIYSGQGDWGRALRVTDRLVSVAPDEAEQIRDRGDYYERLDCHQAACDDYARYVELRPDADDAAALRRRIEALRPLATRLN